MEVWCGPHLDDTKFIAMKLKDACFLEEKLGPT